jgi:colicin import membrane protein
MSEQKESSVLFSLKELMSLEEDRIRTEEAERSAQAAAAEKARLEAERQAREAEEARIRAEEERRRLDEQRSREETARLEAIRVAEIEKARIDAEQRARLEAMTQQQQHERSLAAIHGDEHKHKLRKMLIGVAIAVPLIGGLAGFLVYQDYQAKQTQQAAMVAEQQRLADEKKKLEASLLEQQKKVDSLLADLTNAKDDATRAQLQKQLQEEQQKQQQMRGTGGTRPAAGGAGAPAAPKAKCTPGDPLCSDL